MSLGLHAAADLPPHHRVSCAAHGVSGAREPVHPADAGSSIVVGDLGRRADGDHQHAAIDDVPRLRVLLRRDWHLPRDGARLRGSCCARSTGSCSSADARARRVGTMSRDFDWPELLFLLGAMRWTIVLSLIAFVGGGARRAGRSRCCARRGSCVPARLAAALHRLDPGHAGADAALPRVLRAGRADRHPASIRGPR